MSFNAEKLFKEYSISYITEGKNCSPGWVNIRCPFCQDSSKHLGVNLSNGATHCWKCGKKSLRDVLGALLGVPPYLALGLIKKFSANAPGTALGNNSGHITAQAESLSFPCGTERLKAMHRDYLRKRKFNPEQLEKDWGLLGTGHIGNYKFRIVVPIYFEGRLVSYQARDITGEALLRYKACAKREEVIHHKYLLYGVDRACTDKVVICEGITDCWRLGKGAVATFGIKYTTRQVLLLASRFSKMFILFDSEEQAQEQADRLASELIGLGKKVEILELDQGDPAELSEKEANEIMQLTKK